MARSSSKPKRSGPRHATRWIGDAFVLDGDLTRGAPAVWRGLDVARGKREPRCARVRITEMMRDWEFDHDEEPLHRAAMQLTGDNIVPRLATYREQDLVAIVDDDVGDVSLADLMRALATNEGDPEIGLALFIALACARAHELARSNEVSLEPNPEHIILSWDGGVWLRPALRVVDDQNEYAYDGDETLLVDEMYGQRDIGVGSIAYQLLTGRHPFWNAGEDGEDEDDEDEDDVDSIVQEIRDRKLHGLAMPIMTVPVEVRHLVQNLVEGRTLVVGATPAAVALAEIAHKYPYTARDLAGVLHAFFAERARECAIEREDRLLVMPHAKVEPETWTLFADATPLEDEEGILDLDEVRRGHPDFNDGARYEPSVDAIDPFDDEH